MQQLRMTESIKGLQDFPTISQQPSEPGTAPFILMLLVRPHINLAII